ncbi:MAG: methyl-accepting chemotaxis protein [Gammaproteobacteria bacterium]|nr:methyl-accepting chemotaxis protein [Gammaproteobacteria bacterium]
MQGQVINNQVIHEQLDSDKFVYAILLGHLPFTTWLVPSMHDVGTTGFSVVSSLIIAIIASIAYFVFKGQRIFSLIASICLMLNSVILIQASLGQIEMHFHIFVALAFLLIYRDWLTIVLAAAVIAVHHLLFTYLQLNSSSIGDSPIMLFNYGCSWSIAFLHAIFVVIEAAVLIYYSIRMQKEKEISYLIIDAVEQVAELKNLKSKILQHENEPVVISFNKMMSELSELIGSIKGVADKLNSSGETLNVLSRETNNLVSQQNIQTQEAANATDEMINSVKTVSQNATDAASSAEQVQGQIVNGNNVVKEAVSSVHKMNNMLEDSKETLATLEDNVNTISSVVGVIRGISEQTNLLALNAAIEAARAGEQGRGFAVVADEVRTLAQRTNESTEEIHSMIETLQSGTSKAVKSMELGREQGNITGDKIEKTGEVLNIIADEINTVTSMNNQIANSSIEQTNVAEQLNKNVLNITDSSKEVVSKTDLLDGTACQLNKLSTKLGDSVSNYTAE